MSTVSASRLRPSILRGEPLLWILSLAMGLGAVALLAGSGAGALAPTLHTLRLPLWALVLGFAAAERCVVHLHFRRSAHSMSLGEIPLVFALVFCGGWTVVLASTVGRLLVLVVVRRLPPLRLAFNAGTFPLGGAIAVVCFHAVAASASSIGPRVWVAAGAATMAASVFAVAMISLAVTLTEGAPGARRTIDSLRTDVTVALANTSVGLCAARLVENDWRTAILLCVPVLGMFATMRAYATERERHGRLEFLYEAAHALTGPAGDGEALATLLRRALDAFRADVAEIVFFSPDGEDALCTTVWADGRATLLAPVRAGCLRAAFAAQAGACRIDEVSDPVLAETLRSRGLRHGLFAALHGDSACSGAIAIGARSGVVDGYGEEDVRLFQTLARNTGVALENDRLGHAVWEMQRLQGDLEHQASHDALTGLANRALFGERLAAARRAAVVFIDVNDFKGVNDTLGHAAGDELLVAMAGRLADCVRPGDTLARLGGDEFAILLADGPSEADAVAVAERIDGRLDEPFTVAGGPLVVRVSIGIALGDRDGITTDELVRNADLAMYRAKRDSAHRYELYQDGMEVAVLHHHGLRRRLREAAAIESFAVHYQPIVDLGSGEITAREALVRWVDGPRGAVAPSAFIPAAEEMGVIVAIGRQVLERACEAAVTWSACCAGGTAPAVQVNVSPVELRTDGFLEGVSRALARTGLDPARLVLEVTEGVALDDPERSIARLRDLRALGIGIALDDFGTGYSSLSHLRELPLDQLKIGAPFVDAIGPGGANRPFMRMIVDLAASLGLGVVAEGIETAGQMDALRQLGCGFGQGFHLGRPTAGIDAVPADRVPAIAAR